MSPSVNSASGLSLSPVPRLSMTKILNRASISLRNASPPAAARSAESHDQRNRFAAAANLVAKLEAVFGLGEIANCCHCESPLGRILVMNTNYGRERFKRLVVGRGVRQDRSEDSIDLGIDYQARMQSRHFEVGAGVVDARLPL